MSLLGVQVISLVLACFVLTHISLNSVLSQCARGKSFIAQKLEVHSKIFQFLKTFKKCNPPDFKFHLGKLNNKYIPHMM